MPRDGGVVVFGDRYGANGYPGTEATRSPLGPARGTFTVGATAEGTFGSGGAIAAGGIIGFGNRGILVSEGMDPHRLRRDLMEAQQALRGFQTVY